MFNVAIEGDTLLPMRYFGFFLMNETINYFLYSLHVFSVATLDIMNSLLVLHCSSTTFKSFFLLCALRIGIDFSSVYSIFHSGDKGVFVCYCPEMFLFIYQF